VAAEQDVAEHYLSFDVEEHFNVSAFASPMRRRQWENFQSRVEKNVYKILDILNDRKVRATFFVLGWVAERNPRMVKELVAHGHEVASHGYAHELITSQTPELFRDDVRKAKQILEDLTGERVQGYRAPSFTITSETKWALPVLVEEGYRYDSSIFPVFHDRYGFPGAMPWCHKIETASGLLWEVPPSSYGVLGYRVPVGGGGYFRLFPYPVLKSMLRRIENDRHPLVMYLHPWELDPDQPRMEGSAMSRFRHYLNLDKTEQRLQWLLRDFQFGPIRRSLQGLDGRVNGGATVEPVTVR
jgi:polysaccharide deacetylase family protein (PEP-CTERM system associated)